MISDLLFRLRAMFRRKNMDKELDEELDFHFEREVEKLVRTGLAPEDAVREAGMAFGGLLQVKEECREARGLMALTAVIQDLRYAIRGMRRSPAFTIGSMLTLAFGTGAISTVFTLADTLFFRELPVDRPDRVVVVQATRRHGERPGWVAYPDYVHFRDQCRTLQGLAAHYSTAPLFVTTNDRSQELNGAVVSANFFPLLGVRPVLGRFFAPDEDRVPDRNPVAVISYEMWCNWFSSSADVLDAKLKINGTIFTVIGVAPRGFKGVTVQPDELYIPTMMARSGYRWCADSLANNCTVFDMIGRLQNGYTVAQSRAEVSALVPQSWVTAKEGENTGATVFHAEGALHPDLTPGSQLRFIKLLVAVAGVLLLVCCVNLAGLLIARNCSRTREFAIRASLGAGRVRLIRQLLTEALPLSLSGGVLGIFFSLGLTRALNSMFYSLDSEGHPLNYNFTPELRVVLAVVIISIGAGLLVGFVPALLRIRTDVAESLKRQSSAVSAGARLGHWLAGAQTGVAVALAAVSGLLITSAHLVVAGANFEASHVALLRVRPRLINYPPEKAQRFVRAVIERLETVPGVDSASMVGTGAVVIGGGTQVSLPGWPDPQAINCGYIEIGPRYFATLRTPLLRGREFDQHDTAQSPAVAIVSESLARRLWPTTAVIGRTLLVDARPHRVIGIVDDVPLQSRDAALLPYVYTPFWQNAMQVDARLCVRVKGDPAAMLPALVREVGRVDRNVPIAEVITLPQQMAGSVMSLRIAAGFVSYAALLAVLLSAIGLYGVLAFSVSRRTKEIGIRMAVGARSSEVLAMIIRDGMTVIGVGVAIGGGLSIAAASAVRHLLYGSSAADVRVYGTAVLLVACVGLVACWVPARRAASVEPIIALKEE
jgi:macrolide transport system ATP-binding/permease protein